MNNNDMEEDEADKIFLEYEVLLFTLLRKTKTKTKA